MTANEMIPAVGQQVSLRVDALQVSVTVIDVKFVWGKPRLLVTPVSGSGQKWIELTSLALPSKSTGLAIQ